MQVLVIINVLLVIVSECFSHDLPAYFPRCNLDDPDLNDCIERAANALRPHIRQGIPEMNFPSFDPLVIPIWKIVYENNLVNFTGTARNQTTHGLDNYNLSEIGYDRKTLIFNGKMEVDSIVMSGLSNLTGHLLSIPIDGNGIIQCTFGPINGTFEVTGKIVKRSGIKYYKPISTKVMMVIGDGVYNYHDFFDGNKELGRVTTDMVNRNSKIITDALTPALEGLAERGLMYLMNSLMQTVPYGKLFANHINTEN